MSNFITNTNAKDLRKRLIELIQKSDELKYISKFGGLTRKEFEKYAKNI